MKKEKKPIIPEAEIIVFPSEEIIVTSGGNNPINQYGEDDPPLNP